MRKNRKIQQIKDNVKERQYWKEKVKISKRSSSWKKKIKVLLKKVQKLRNK